MVEAVDVCAILKEHADLEELSVTELLPVCKRAIGFVLENLRDGADPDCSLVAETAAAEARFRLFHKMLSVSDRFESYKAGDMTLKRSIEKELRLEKEMRDEAFARAAGILKDGGFFFEACGQ